MKLSVLRIRDFRLLWCAGLVSGLGSWLLVIAVPMHVFLVSRSLLAAGAVLAAEYAPSLVLAPIAGVLADRYDRRALMFAADVFRAGAVALLLASGHAYWITYLALAAESAGTVVSTPALRARIPAIVGTGPDLASAAALNAMTSGVVGLVGGPLGGLLLTFTGMTPLIWADVASYLVAAALMLMTSRSSAPGAGSADRIGLRSGRSGFHAGWAGFHAGLAAFSAGWSALRAEPAVRVLLPVNTLFLAANASLTALFTPFAVTRLGGARQAGVLLLALSAGYLLGAPLIRALLASAIPRYLLASSLAVTAITYSVMFGSSSLAQAVPSAFVMGLAGSMTLASIQTTIQRLIPHNLLGRVSAVFVGGEAAATLLGSATGPLIAQLAGILAAAITASVLTLVSAILAWPQAGGPAGDRRGWRSRSAAIPIAVQDPPFDPVSDLGDVCRGDVLQADT
jgi:predicted MFS family arabinose efflux permease